MLGKISHSFATAVLGVGGFHPLAIDLALGRTDRINYLVGGQFDAPMEATDNFHELNVWVHEPYGIVLVIIRLFAYLGAPTYHVVTGLKEGGKLAQVVERIT